MFEYPLEDDGFGFVLIFICTLPFCPTTTEVLTDGYSTTTGGITGIGLLFGALGLFEPPVFPIVCLTSP